MKLIRPCVVTGADHPTGLGTGRSLFYGLRPQIIGMAANVKAPCCRSRVWSRVVQQPEREQEIVAALLSLAKTFSIRPILVPSQDFMVRIISENRDVLGKHYLFLLPNDDVVDLLLDKTKFQKWAEKKGFPVPESRIVTNFSEMKEAVVVLGGHVVIKPLERTAVWDEHFPNDKVFKVQSESEVDDLPLKCFNYCREFLAQRWISGDDGNVYFCLSYYRKSVDSSFFCGRKIMQWPIDCGSTALAESVQNKELVKLTEEVFRACDFIGLGSIEYKYCDKLNKFFIIEPTVGRNDFQSFITLKSGVNYTRCLYNELSENIFSQKNKFYHCFWMDEGSILELISKIGITNVLKIIPFPLLNKYYFSLFSFFDPLPFCFFIKNKIFNKFRSYLR